MSELTVIETGQIVEQMSRVEAERITARIADKLDSIADNLEQVLPLIGEALTCRAWESLGYASPTAYVSERFAGALTRLSPDIRRPVVAQLSAAGMSTRAIGPVLGVSHESVAQDIRAGVKDFDTSPDEVTYDSTSPKPQSVTGMDGKTYTRPAPSALSPAKPKRRPLWEQVEDAEVALGEALDKLIRLGSDDRFQQNREALRDRIKVNTPQLWDQKIQRICDTYGLNRLAEMKEATHSG